MEFLVLAVDREEPEQDVSKIYLRQDNWDDFGYCTSFVATVFDDRGICYPLGTVKIGFVNQQESTKTYDQLDSHFDKLPEHFFSVGQDISFYTELVKLPSTLKKIVLAGLRDVAFDKTILTKALVEPVFKTSLLRTVSLQVIKGQYSRVIAGENALTDYRFSFMLNKDDNPVEFPFVIEAGANPGTNIHGLIGSNGVGKTTILNGMIDSIIRGSSTGRFLTPDGENLPDKFFSSVLSVSFSAFDAFTPPAQQEDPTQGVCYFYVGLQKQLDDASAHFPDIDEKHIALKNRQELNLELVNAFSLCCSIEAKKKLLFRLLKTLENASNFDQFGLSGLENAPISDIKRHVFNHMRDMSSGHALIFLTLVKLVAHVEHQTLVIIDEPESHLHPPLLAAFIRALSDLLIERNAVCIMATHSPVVLQEIPKSCVIKVQRVEELLSIYKPDIETYGENVGILTSEVFGLEVSRSGFLSQLKESIDTGLSYKDIIEGYQDQLGLEARAILKGLIALRDKEACDD